ncbi:MAG: monoheme cytochrome C, partial [Saonia sp.]
MENHQEFKKGVNSIYRLLLGTFVLFGLMAIGVIYLVKHPTFFESKPPEPEYVVVPEEEDFDKIENGIHLRTGFI